jgi:hypothetical protein
MATMAAADVPALTPAVITASASIVVAVLVFVGNQLAQARNERRQAALDRVNTQLRELYGPLFALVEVNEHLWRAVRESHLPGRDERASAALSESQTAQWRTWLSEALMPANKKMRDVIVQHADLLLDNDMPQVLQDFCAHVASYEVLLSRMDQPSVERTVVRHPGKPYVSYVQTSYAALRKERERLLARRRR